ncbi:MAG: hypothetical protein ABR66_01230 [Microbacteriaceae bacterium BACL25 MAG-120322-bin65]|nr:MAG: hypothetical protein ABR66_01230 [Microbacteriaceae bacterium BACL25 MAG-120322-bin65]HAA79187.1 hypothetical protein [Microbacteriaceae bacterium]
MGTSVAQILMDFGHYIVALTRNEPGMAASWGYRVVGTLEPEAVAQSARGVGAWRRVQDLFRTVERG